MKVLRPLAIAPVLLAVVLATPARVAAAETYSVGVENLDYYPHCRVRDGAHDGDGRAILDAFAADSSGRVTPLGMKE